MHRSPCGARNSGSLGYHATAAVFSNGIWGVSLGGYFAPRAAAFEKRIKACVALSGPYQRSGNFDGRRMEGK